MFRHSSLIDSDFDFGTPSFLKMLNSTCKAGQLTCNIFLLQLIGFVL